MHIKKFTQILLALVLAITIVSGVKYAYAIFNNDGTFTDASCTPPLCNTSAPLNTGTGSQTKSGALILGGVSVNAFSAQQNSIFKQNVGIGMTGSGIPSTDLEINSAATYAKPTSTTTTGAQLLIGNSNGSGSGKRIEIGYDTTNDYGFINAGNYFPASGSGSRNLNIQPDGGLTTLGGQIKIAGGTPGAGKVLTSDASGLASWVTPGSGLGGSGTTGYISKWTSSSALGNSSIFDNGSGVAIGSTTVSAGLALDVNGYVGANQYCDGSGNNCFAPTATTSVTLTTHITDNNSHTFLPSTAQFFGTNPNLENGPCKVYVVTNADVGAEFTVYRRHDLLSNIKTIFNDGSINVTAGYFINGTNDSTIKVSMANPDASVISICY